MFPKDTETLVYAYAQLDFKSLGVKGLKVSSKLRK